MKTSLLSLFAGTVFLTGAAIASAGEPVTLASGQLDAVTAGQIDLDRSGIAAILQSIRQSNDADVRVDQDASASVVGIGNATATNTSTVTISQSNTNSGSQTNSGSANAVVAN
jgi:hypothetical protein